MMRRRVKPAKLRVPLIECASNDEEDQQMTQRDAISNQIYGQP